MHINEVLISENTMKFQGFEFDKPFQIKENIDKVTLKIKSKPLSRKTFEYFLEFHFNRRVINVNEQFNWDYTYLQQLFYKFKEAKQEKITADKKLLLERINNK